MKNLRRSRLRAALPVLACLASATLAVADGPTSESAYSGLRWRQLGPLRAGWSICATGVPGRPHTFYFGAADGGVWRTGDAGRTWSGLFQDQRAASIGALAVAPSNPDVLYVGTGQVETRYDIVSGTGVYRSDDGGRTWSSRGLEDTRHIGALLVDPRDAGTLLVAAQGHVFGPSDQRGVFRSTDGGTTWTRTLFVDDGTGAVDLASDPAEPDVVYAATWQLRRWPWLDYFTPGAGPGSGVWKSNDAGRTWRRLGGGLPTGDLGRIGLAVGAQSHAGRVYASIESEQAGGLYRSDDGGASFERVNPDGSLANSYFSRLTPDPREPDTLYVMGRSAKRSTDGGRSFTIVRGAPGGDDFHFMWIDPADPARRILAADQGTIVSLNGGRTWSSWYNQPTGQFYRLGADERFPWWLYSSQQDSGTAAVATRSDYGQLTYRDWHPVGGDERDFALPFPGDPDTVFVSGLGGRLSRFDARTGRSANVSPWPANSYGQRPTTVRYRYPWITPLAISPVAPHAVYQGAQVLFRSLDRGQTWETISPDLTGADPGATGCDDDQPVERATACGYGTIFTIAPSPRERDQVWVGTDNCRVQLTRDGGRSWQDVTPPGAGDWSKIASLDASAHEAGTAYAAVDRHRLDDFTPHVYRTHDFGRTWSEVSVGLPPDEYVSVVRQDPVEARLLFAGTRAGVFVSFDDGGRWQPLRLNLPTTGVNDLLLHGNDLAAATQGRGLWLLDDLSPLRQLARGLPEQAAYLFPPAMAYRVGANEYRDTPLPREEPTTPNPPAGVALDYQLARAPDGPVRLEILDASGNVVRRFSSDEIFERPKAERYFEEEWLREPERLSAEPGFHRFYWNLRRERPSAPEYEYGIGAVPGVDTPALPQGALVAAGRYQVRLSAGGATQLQPLVVAPDPRVQVAEADVAAQLALQQDVAAALGRLTGASEELESLEARLRVGPKPDLGLRAQLAKFGKGPDSFSALAGVLASLAVDLESADGPPTEPQRQVAREYARRFDAQLALFKAWRDEHAGRLRRLEAARPPGSPR